MQEKETITSNRYGWKLFLQYLGRTSLLRKQPPSTASRPENPICTGYWWKIVIVQSYILQNFQKVNNKAYKYVA